MKALYVTWQDPETRRWYPVGRLTYKDGTYAFAYTRGAKASTNFVPFGRMVNLDVVYLSNELFPLFANRMLPKSRPDYREYLSWLGLDESKADELAVLARSGGQRATDTLEIVPCPEPTPDNNYVAYFFAHGLRYMSDKDQERVTTLNVGDRLFLMRDVQNRADPMALLMRTGDPMSMVGYVPRYYSAEFSAVMDRVGQEYVQVSVERVNPDAPSNFRLLCKLVAPWPVGFAPCSQDQFEPLAPAN
ncbi:MAG: hypothetical protein HY527_02315 [Betaproteobacteria bacterium]|nr:hypothetical protein [Betaproteobacteria bacterium]